MARIVRIALLVVCIALLASLIEAKFLRRHRNRQNVTASQKRGAFLNNVVKSGGLESIQNLESVRSKLQAYREKQNKTAAAHVNKAAERRAAAIEKSRVNDDVEPVDTIGDINAGLDDFLYDGDMMLTDKQADQLVSDSTRSKRQALTTSTARWPKSTPIPYVIDPSIDALGAELIHDSVAFWQDNTCLKFKENATGSSRIRFNKGEGCSSYVGRVTSMPEQEISIGDRCDYFGIVTHEIAHALGIYHHQSRTDRDDYIQIALENVPAGWEGNFDDQPLTNNYNTPYEYGSSMHYAEKILESDKVQIIANDPRYQRSMGNRNRPTFNDVKIINLYYACASACTAKITCQNEGYQNPAICSKCICPGGFGGDDCSTVAAPELGAANCGGILNATADWQTLVGQVGESSTTIYKRQQACHWQLKAAENKTISIKVNYIRGPCSLGCFYGATEIKLGNFTNTGVRMCCSSDVSVNGNLQTTGPLAVISAYSQLAVEKFSIQFKTNP